MDKKTGSQVRVGIFVSLGIILTMVVIFMLEGKQSLFERNIVLSARFKDISGLRQGASVFLAGVNVGTVSDIRFPKSLDVKEVEVDMKIMARYQDRIREDSQAAIVTQGLLGDKVILLKIGTPDSPEIKNGDTLKTGKAFSIDSLADDGGELIENLKDVSKSLNSVLKDVKEKKSLLHALIYDYKGEDIIGEVAAMSRSTHAVINEVQHGKGFLHALIYDKSDPQLAKNIAVTVGNMKKTSDNLNQVTQRIEKGEGTIGGLVNDPTVYYDLKTLLGNANRSKLIKAVIRYTLLQNEKQTLQ